MNIFGRKPAKAPSQPQPKPKVAPDVVKIFLDLEGDQFQCECAKDFELLYSEQELRTSPYISYYIRHALSRWKRFVYRRRPPVVCYKAACTTGRSFLSRFGHEYTELTERFERQLAKCIAALVVRSTQSAAASDTAVWAKATEIVERELLGTIQLNLEPTTGILAGKRASLYIADHQRMKSKPASEGTFGPRAGGIPEIPGRRPNLISEFKKVHMPESGTLSNSVPSLSTPTLQNTPPIRNRSAGDASLPPRKARNDSTTDSALSSSSSSKWGIFSAFGFSRKISSDASATQQSNDTPPVLLNSNPVAVDTSADFERKPAISTRKASKESIQTSNEIEQANSKPKGTITVLVAAENASTLSPIIEPQHPILSERKMSKDTGSHSPAVYSARKESAIVGSRIRRPSKLVPSSLPGGEVTRGTAALSSPSTSAPHSGSSSSTRIPKTFLGGGAAGGVPATLASPGIPSDFTGRSQGARRQPSTGNGVDSSSPMPSSSITPSKSSTAGLQSILDQWEEFMGEMGGDESGGGTKAGKSGRKKSAS